MRIRTIVCLLAVALTSSALTTVILLKTDFRAVRRFVGVEPPRIETYAQPMDRIELIKGVKEAMLPGLRVPNSAIWLPSKGSGSGFLGINLLPVKGATMWTRSVHEPQLEGGLVKAEMHVSVVGKDVSATYVVEFVVHPLG